MADHCSRRSYWNEEGRDRHEFLRSVFGLLDEEGWRYSTDTGWNDWDIHIYGNFWWSIALQTVTEYHGGPKCLTRVKLLNRFVTTTVIINLIVLTLLIYHQLITGRTDLGVLVPYSAFVAFVGVARAETEAACGRTRRSRGLSRGAPADWARRNCGAADREQGRGDSGGSWLAACSATRLIMPAALLLRFAVALTGEIILCAALNLFDDWTLAEMPVRFVACGLVCGIAFLAAVSVFPTGISFA